MELHYLNNYGTHMWIFQNLFGPLMWEMRNEKNNLTMKREREREREREVKEIEE